MAPDPSGPPPVLLVLLLMLGAVGLALLAVGITTGAGWSLIVPGFLALAVGLCGAWIMQSSRDRTLR